MATFGVKMAAAVVLGAIAVAGSAAAAIAQSRVDWLGSGETIMYDGFLYEGEAVNAVCDDDCYDIDLFLYDAETGDLVASDTMEDAAPGVIAPYEGNFLIEVVMADCSLESCETWTDSEAGF